MPNPFRGASGSMKARRAVDGVKILLDIAKESSDWCPPLKSALGGVTALIKHYEQYKDVKEKAAQLVPWLKKLKYNFATVADGMDPEEQQQRAELSRSLEEIGKWSQVLLEKEAASRLFDKGKDSQEVVNLVEELRTAIAFYQLSQQQSIYKRMEKLTSSFDTLLKLRRESPVTRRKIKATFARLDRLGLGEDNENVANSMRRADLFITLNRIKHKLQGILDRIETAGYSEDGGDVQVVSELMDAIIDYQTVHQQTIYDQNLKLIDRADMSVLNSCRRAHGAGYRHGNRNGCLKGTREGVLDEIELWPEDFETSPIFWLSGLAGTGKSTIAQTIAERLFADNRLGASFFCSRGFEDRSDLQLIFPTLAFQLAQQHPEFRSSLVPLLQSNPDIDHESLLDQMQKLLVEPLRSSNISTVIVIDALDECRDDEPESAILLILGRSVSKIPGVKFFITSRPEAHITCGFRGPLLKDSTDIFILHQVEPRTIDNDIRRFFKHELSGVAHRRGRSEGWPTDEQLGSLCRRAAGFFVYAVATVNFLKHRLKRPSDRLNTIMESPESTAHEGGVELKVYASLDSLYTSILREAFRKSGNEDNAMVRSVLSAVVLVTNPLSPSAIAALTGFECDEVVLLLESIQSLLVLHEDIDHPIQPFHKSFPDFITDPDRCTDQRFHVSPDYHTELFLHFLEYMGESLKKNICSVPDYILNSEVEDLPERIEESGIRRVLEHACRSWYKHLIVTKHRTSDVLSALRDFLEEKFVFWLEVLSVLGAVGDATRALSAAVKWLNEIQVSDDVSTLLNTTKDCLRFVTEFFEVISQSAPHIYHSALPLVPRSSMVRKLYGQHIHSPLSRVVTGIPTSWDSCTASAGAASKVCRAAWSPCGQFVAVGMGAVIEVRDSNTLEKPSTLEAPNIDLSPAHSLSFSPDGRLFACLQEQRNSLLRSISGVGWWLDVWDIQTGVIIRSVGVRGRGEIAFFDNSNRRVVGLLPPSLLSEQNQFYVYDALEDTRPCKVGLPWLPGQQLGAHWTHEDSLRFATSFEIAGHVMIEIHELKQASHLLPVVESFHVPHHSGKFSFSPVSFHASFVTETDVVILDVRDSRALLGVNAAQSPFIPPGHFSPDGRFFVCGTEEPRIFVWENGSTDYGPWSNFRPRLLFEGLSFSPIMSSILTWGQQGIQLLGPGNQTAFLSPDKTGYHHQRHNHLVAYSADGTLIATNQHGLWILKSVPNARSSTLTPRTSYLPVELEILEDGSIRNVTKELLDSPWSWVNLFSCGCSIGIGSMGWVVDPNGKKLLWLPPNWRAKNVEDVRWNGNFLAFLHSHHPDPIVVQFCP